MEPQVLFAEEIYYIWMHFWIKICFLLFYLRLAKERTYRMLVFDTIGLTGVITLTIRLIYCLQCDPPRGLLVSHAVPRGEVSPVESDVFCAGKLGMSDTELFLACIILFLPVTMF
ncbi:hypothetical protein AYL99_07828 [Fonsecaea erecta]|uniref:Rhodopsin domain-containing protein n=1 Tax=Fonsecaea erecta TaxID=1367422 RepID=A0A178ZG37_9EURO|nr:hypothetical protein AYL99_07828 [Fonsecaea erecta]OAP58738.1 hypothetical protein AYL99_07828 [Fonsecaea erecta]